MRLFSFGPGNLKPGLLKMNIQFPLIFVIVKHVLRNDHYRNTVLVFTPEITATLKVKSHYKGDLGHEQTGISH